KPTANTCRKLSSAHWVHIGGKRFALRTKEVVVMRVHSRVSFWTVVVMLVLTVSMVASAQTRIPIGVLVPFTGAGAAEGPFLRNTVELAFEEIHEMLAAGGSDIRFQQTGRASCRGSGPPGGPAGGVQDE